jgi:hypothetical protein
VDKDGEKDRLMERPSERKTDWRTYRQMVKPTDDVKTDVGKEGHRCRQCGSKTNRCKDRMRERQTQVNTDGEKDRQTEGSQREVVTDGEKDRHI